MCIYFFFRDGAVSLSSVDFSSVTTGPPHTLLSGMTSNVTLIGIMTQGSLEGVEMMTSVPKIWLAYPFFCSLRHDGESGK